jgi:glutaredoxin
LNIRFYGSRNCEDSERSGAFLDKLGLPFEFIDVDHDQSAAEYASSLNHGHLKTPTIVFGDHVVVEPSDEELGKELRHAGIYPPSPELKIV